MQTVFKLGYGLVVAAGYWFLGARPVANGTGRRG